MANHIQITCQNIFKTQEEKKRRQIFTQQWGAFISQKENIPQDFSESKISSQKGFPEQ